MRLDELGAAHEPREPPGLPAVGGERGGEVVLDVREELAVAPELLEEPLERLARHGEARVQGQRLAVPLGGDLGPPEPLLVHLARAEEPLRPLPVVAGGGRLALERLREPLGVAHPGAEPAQRGERGAMARVEREHRLAGLDGLVGPVELELLDLGAPEEGAHRLGAVLGPVEAGVGRGDVHERRGRLVPAAVLLEDPGEPGEELQIARRREEAPLEGDGGLREAAEPLLGEREGVPGLGGGGAGEGLGLGAQDRGERRGLREALGVAARAGPEQPVGGQEVERLERERAGAVEAPEGLLEEGRARGEVMRREDGVGRARRAAGVGVGEGGAVAGGGGLGGDLLGGREPHRVDRDGLGEQRAPLVGAPERGEEPAAHEEQRLAIRRGAGGRGLDRERLGGERVVALLEREAALGGARREEAGVGGGGPAPLLGGAGEIAEAVLEEPGRGVVQGRGGGAPGRSRLAHELGDLRRGVARRDGGGLGAPVGGGPFLGSGGVVVRHGGPGYGSQRSMRPALRRISSAPRITASRSLPCSFTTCGGRPGSAPSGGTTDTAQLSPRSRSARTRYSMDPLKARGIVWIPGWRSSKISYP
ncbi:MAG: hypothetical protein QM704_19110 [Anaeromyxobacteraceae bacterium]